MTLGLKLLITTFALAAPSIQAGGFCSTNGSCDDFSSVSAGFCSFDKTACDTCALTWCELDDSPSPPCFKGSVCKCPQGGCAMPLCSSMCYCEGGNCDMPQCQALCSCAGGNCTQSLCTSACSCDDGDCDMGSCTSQCNCEGGGCDMGSCTSQCNCEGGGCDMSSCRAACTTSGTRLVSAQLAIYNILAMAIAYTLFMA